MIALKRWCCLAAVLGLAVLPGRTPAQTEEIQADLQRALFELSFVRNNRLGANLESPSAAVAAQLDLPRGQGQVVKSVQPNSAAAKAGIQVNDILLEVDGKPVSSNMQEFQKVLDAVKADAAVEVMVLRKSQKTPIKGLKMPAAQANGFGQLGQNGFNGAFSGLQPGFGFPQAMIVPQVPGQLVPADVQGKLKLTAEQKEKLAKLQKDAEAKFMELLTDEQKKQLEDMKKNAAAGRGGAPTRDVWLGVQLDVEAENCTIQDVFPGSPAEKAGLKANDVVLKFDGQKVESYEELGDLVRKKKAGNEVTIEVKRGDKTMTLKATLANRAPQPKAEDAPKRQEQPKKEPAKDSQGQNPKQPPAKAAAEPEAQDVVIKFITAGRGAGANRLGATLESPSDTVANQLNLPQGQGVVVRQVPANSAAAKAGLQPNDIVLEIGGKTISRNPAEFDKTLEQIKPDAAVDAIVLRKGEKTTIKGVTLPMAAARPANLVSMMNPPAKVPGDILPAELQGKLKFTTEQKEKLAKLQKDTEAKLMELLTDEQKKQLEELKKNQVPIQLKLLIDNIFEQEIELIPQKK